MKIFILICGMMIVTYIPRMIPAIYIDKMKFSPKVEKYLQLIPYTAMTALIFPGVVYMDKGNIVVGIVGGISAVILSLFKMPSIVVIIGSIAAVMLEYVIYP